MPRAAVALLLFLTLPLLLALERGGGMPLIAAARRWPEAELLVGPEGGFDDAERAAVRALAQARAISLGPRVLRGETAAIAATALWMGTRGDWQAPA